jgi:hypothetical protein
MEKVIRPQSSTKRISTKEFELSYIRHQYFRRVKYNPTEEEMSPYKYIVKYTAKNTFYTYRYLFDTVGMGPDDIMNIGMVHLVNFLGLFQIDYHKNRQEYKKFLKIYVNKNGKKPDKTAILGKNKAILTLFIKQRMEDLVRICTQKAKNIKGTKVEEYIAFYGPNKPPENIFSLLEDHESHGFKKANTVLFKAIKKKMKARLKEPFQFAASWYIAVPLEHRNLTILDFAGAGLDPYENSHNLTPEQVLTQRQDEIMFDKKKEKFQNYTKERRTKILMDFIEKNMKNPKLEEEVKTAKKFIENMDRNVR